MKMKMHFGLLRYASALLLMAATSQVHALAIYDVSMTGDLTINAFGGGSLSTSPETPTLNTSSLVNPTGFGTATPSATFTNYLPSVSNSIRVQTGAAGSALATSSGTTSTATGTASGTLAALNTGTAGDVLLTVTIDIDWSWMLLVDNPATELVSAALSLDLYVDGNFVRTLANEFISGTYGSDSLLATVMLDLSDPLVTLGPGQSHSFTITASATGSATSVPEPSTLALLLSAGMGLAWRPIQRRPH